MPNTFDGSYWRYLGKACREADKPTEYHLLVYHCLDVAAVGGALLRRDSAMLDDLSELLSLPPEQLERLLLFLLALHDLGKFSAAFQHLPVFESFESDLDVASLTYNASTHRHDRLGVYLVDRLFGMNNVDIAEWVGRSVNKRKSTKHLKVLFDGVLGHHGKPVLGSSSDMPGYFCEENVEDAAAFVADIHRLFGVSIPLEQLVNRQWLDNVKIASWLMAGWAVISDWLGSDRYYFPYTLVPMSLATYWDTAQQQAWTAVEETDLGASVTASEFMGFEAQFGFSPTPLQSWAEAVPLSDQPQLFILEDITGSGKTEAALTLVHRLMAEGHAKGFYFGLPTMATSNAMFQRVGRQYRQMFQAGERPPSLVLAHSAREMDDGFRDAVGTSEWADKSYDASDDSASIFCNRWLADSRKKALLAPVGVGTIDQVLLGVLPRRHQSLRIFGLHNKVLVIDEVHTADAYMLALLEKLLKLHLHQGGSAILLTATLSINARERLCQVWQPGLEMPPDTVNPARCLTQKRALDDFPLVTHAAVGRPLTEERLDSRKDVARHVDVAFQHAFEGVVEQVLAAAESGQCVVWVRNSVGSAQEAYCAVRAQMEAPDNCLLFHSRFTLQDRKRIETTVLDWIGKQSTADQRAGKVIITTQVFQESLDADADVLISDLCPIDDLVQRAGRLHRHSHSARGERGTPVLTIHAPEWSDQPGGDWLGADFRDTHGVYTSSALLWMSMKVMKEKGGYDMPQDARTLIESVYGDLRPDVPDALYESDLELRSKNKRKTSDGESKSIDWAGGYTQSSNASWPESEADIGTRFIEQETHTLMLVRREQDQLQPWVDDLRFPVELSCVKLTASKVGKLTALLEPDDIEATDFVQRYPKAAYQKLWVVEEDMVMRYSSEEGVSPLLEIQR